MESHCPMRCGCDSGDADHGPKPFVTNITRMAQENQNFRTAFWTGCRLQMTLMCIPACGEIGAEVHPETDQLIRVEAGQAQIRMGAFREKLGVQRRLGAGEVIFVPCGTWHNVINAGNAALKLSSVYAPPRHPRGAAHPTRADAAQEEA